MKSITKYQERKKRNEDSAVSNFIMRIVMRQCAENKEFLTLPNEAIPEIFGYSLNTQQSVDKGMILMGKAVVFY